MESLSRRSFLQWGSAAAALSAVPGVLARGLRAAPNLPPGEAPILILVRLDGGVDGLNTVVPAGFQSSSADHYYTWRPNNARGLGVPENLLLPLDAEFGLHPSLSHLKALFDRGELAVVHGVGYPDMDRSHFRGAEILDSGDPAVRARGVFGRYLDEAYDPVDGIIRGLDLSGRASRVLQAARANLMIGRRLGDFEMPRDYDAWFDTATRNEALRQSWSERAAEVGTLGEIVRIGNTAQGAAPAFSEAAQGWSWAGSDPGLEFAALDAAGNRYAESFETLSQVLSAASLVAKPQVFHLSIGGFDTHSDQGRLATENQGHPQRLRWLSECIGAFLDDMGGRGMRERIVFVTLTEFGRRVQPNGSRGTDHGTAFPVFVAGERVAGGLYGQHPSLQRGELDPWGDLVPTTDFRAVYATLLRGLLGADDLAILGGDHYQAGLDFLAAS